MCVCVCVCVCYLTLIPKYIYLFKYEYIPKFLNIGLAKRFVQVFPYDVCLGKTRMNILAKAVSLESKPFSPSHSPSLLPLRLPPHQVHPLESAEQLVCYQVLLSHAKISLWLWASTSGLPSPFHTRKRLQLPQPEAKGPEGSLYPELTRSS